MRGTRQREKRLLQSLAVGLRLEFLRRTLRDDLAVIDDGDALGHAVGFFHVMRGEKHRHLFFFVELLDVGPELVAGLRIEAERGLVEEQDFGRVQQAAGDLQAALHAAGELLHWIVAAVPELEQLEQPFDALLADLARDFVEDAVEVHVFVGGELVVEAGVLEDDAEAFAHLGVMRPPGSSRPARPCRWWASAAW